jgi:hypothetical protein
MMLEGEVTIPDGGAGARHVSVPDTRWVADGTASRIGDGHSTRDALGS